MTSRDVVASWSIALRGLKKLKRVRGSRVKLSPDSPADEGVRPTQCGEPWGKNKILTANHSYSQMIVSGKLANGDTDIHRYHQVSLVETLYRISSSS